MSSAGDKSMTVTTAYRTRWLKTSAQVRCSCGWRSSWFRPVLWLAHLYAGTHVHGTERQKNHA